MAKTLGSVSEGSIVYLNESGSPVEFYVAKHDYESALNGAGRTLLVRKNLYDTRVWNSSGVNTYASSAIDTWLNGTWILLLDDSVRSAAGTTKFYYTVGNKDATITALSRAAFLLSVAEYGLTNASFNAEGSALPIASELLRGYLDDTLTKHWTRSANLSNSKYAAALDNPSTGTPGVLTSFFQNVASQTYGSRPCITLPETINVDDSGNITAPEAQTLPHGAMINNVLCVTKKCYAMIDGVLCAVPYGLANIDGVTMTIPFAPSAETIEQYPSIVGNLTYTGSAQSPQWADYDSSKMSIGGTQSGTNAGSYTTTFTPLEGYVWPDGSTDAYSVTWSIAKAAGKVTLSKTSVSVGVNVTTTFTVTRSGNGAISVSSSAAGTARATLSGTTVSVTGVKIGSATITVSVAEGTNHLAASATCAATVAPNYRVVIDTGNYGEHDTGLAYFQINGTKYDGGTKTTLTVAGGTEYTAYASLKDANNAEVGYVELNGTKVKTGGSYKGTVSSNMTVRVGCLIEPAYYAYIASVRIITS